MRELYDPSVDQIVMSRKNNDEDDGPIESVFLDETNSKDDKSLLKYGNQICSYIYWAQQSQIPLKLEGKKNSDLISQLCELVVNTKLYSKLHASDYIFLLISHQFVHNELLPLLESLENLDRSSETPD